MHYLVLISVARWRHNFRQIAVKNCENSKKSEDNILPVCIVLYGTMLLFLVLP